ncbi:MAG: tyrosine-type recombinase/integrase [Calditrichaeota bacterium]|nr:tyrosine-type recombinase/integrase [Calditrichota bacterium]
MQLQLPGSTQDIIRTEVDTLAQDFLNNLRGSTLTTYRNGLNKFCQFLGVKDIGIASQLFISNGHGQANSIALKFRTHLQEQGLSANSINASLTALRALIKFARRISLIGWSLEVDNVKAEPYRDTRGLNLRNIERLFSMVSSRTDKKGLRDHAILRLLFVNALRRSEVCSLGIDHYDRENNRLWIKGKGHTDRIAVTIAPKTGEALELWTSKRGNLPGSLFLNLDRSAKGESRLTSNGLYKMIKSYGVKLGLDIRPHGLRHSSITCYLNSSEGDVRGAQRLSRHKKLETLMIYDDNRSDLGGKASAVLDSLV